MSRRIFLEDRKSVYLFSVKGLKMYKIGISNNPLERLKGLQTSCFYQLMPVFCARVQNAEKLEAVLHDRFRSKNTVGEWFELEDEEVKDAIRLMRLSNADLLDILESLPRVDTECPECGGTLSRVDASSDSVRSILEGCLGKDLTRAQILENEQVKDLAKRLEGIGKGRTAENREKRSTWLSKGWPDLFPPV